MNELFEALNSFKKHRDMYTLQVKHSLPENKDYYEGVVSGISIRIETICELIDIKKTTKS